MVSLHYLALVASSMLCLSSAAPSGKVARQFSTGVYNNTQEFYIQLAVTDGDATHNQYKLSAFHTGAGTADPVFVPTTESATPAFLNGTQLQFDVSPYAFSANGLPFDENYARWEPVTISSGFGNAAWINDGPNGLQVDNDEHDGWLVCEWSHGANVPQLFQLVKGFDTVPGAGPYDIPSSCARVLLFPIFI